MEYVGEFAESRRDIGLLAAFLLAGLGTVVLGMTSVCAGFGLYAVNRGRSALWSLCGLTSCCGLPILLVLKDLRSEIDGSEQPVDSGDTAESPLPESGNPYQS